MCNARFALIVSWIAASSGRLVAAAFDLQAAVRDAEPGATIRVPAGAYPAPLVIDKPLTLIADAGTTIDARGRGDCVHVDAPGVTLRGFALRGTGDSLDRENAAIVVAAPRARIEDNTLDDVLLGIVLRSAHGTIVRGNAIHGKPLSPGRRGDAIRLWNSHDCRLEQNRVTGARDVVIWYSQRTRLIANEVTLGRYGLHFMYAHDSVLDANRLTDNSVGVYLMYSRDILLRRNLLARNRGPSGYAIGLKDMDNVTVEENVLLANRVGVYLDNSPQRIDGTGRFERNVVAYNDVGLAFLPSVRRNHFRDNAFVDNVEQVAILGSGEFGGNEFTVDGRGNYWSDYAGFDANGDGVGDVAYRATGLFESLMDREPKLRLFLYSPAQQAVELAARAFPIVRPRPKLTDAAPLMRPVDVPIAVASSAGGGSMAGAAAALLTVSTAVWTAVRRRRTRADAVHVPLDDDRPGPPRRPGCDTPILALRGLRKHFGRHVAVDSLALDAVPGQAVALWGPNGAGKTTVLKCILGLLRYRGEVRVADLDARKHGKAARRCIGYVSQELAYYDDMTARDVAALFARLRGAPRTRADAVLARVGLAEHAAKRVGALSGGMKQRLALAIALLDDPPLLLLDEPTSNLDAAARRDFLDLLVDLRDAGKAILFTTHRSDEVARLADRLVMLDRGRVVYDGSPEHLERSAAALAIVRIPLPAAQRAAAAALLADAGFAVAQNHSALLVRAPALRKAAPIGVLARAGFAVENIEIESEAGDES